MQILLDCTMVPLLTGTESMKRGVPGLETGFVPVQSIHCDWQIASPQPPPVRVGRSKNRRNKILSLTPGVDLWQCSSERFATLMAMQILGQTVVTHHDLAYCPNR